MREKIKALPNMDAKRCEKALSEYLFYLLQRYDFPNRRFILDASIDRRYVQLFPYLKQHAISFLIIRLEVPREVIVERIMEREGALAPNYLRLLDHWFKDYEAFGKQYKNYFLFKNVPEASLEPLIEAIEQRLANM